MAEALRAARASAPGPEAPGYPVADLRAYLAGVWRLVRTLEDRRTGQKGRFEGRAVFREPEEGEGTVEAGGLAYREEGRLVLGGFETLAHRAYLYRFPLLHLAEVRFADGRAFHRLDLSGGVWDAEHGCGGDLYRGSFRALGPDGWTAVWEVAGPRKDQRLSGRFTRLA